MNNTLKELCDNIGEYLPLEITFCEIVDHFISFGSLDWNFYSDSNWRIIEGKKLLCSNENLDFIDVEKFLKSITIVSITPLTDDNLDIVFELSNNSRLQVFSMSNEEPWKVSLSDIVYVPYFE